jgi:hypothetical protein
MTRTTSIYRVLSVCILLVFASCTKEALQPVPSSNSAVAKYPIINSLEAGNWIKESAYNFYSCTFTNILPAQEQRKGLVISVFVIDGSKEIPLQESVSFMNGLIWCNSDGTSLKVLYTCSNSSDKLPFSKLDIKIVIRQMN